jgi:hypothetical protein
VRPSKEPEEELRRNWKVAELHAANRLLEAQLHQHDV